MPAHAATTNATIDPLSNLFPLLLDMSNGLPPPPPESDWAFLVDEAALLVDDDVSASFELVVAGTLVPRPPSVDCIDVEVAAADGVDAAAAVVSAVDSKVCELDTRSVDLDLWLVVVLIVDCAIGVALDGVVDTTTPGLAVGSVTESATVGWALSWTWVLVAACVVAVACSVGHSACRIPPFLIIPSNVLEFTLTFEQAWLTLPATEVNAAAQSAEHPGDSKSATVHDGIWLSYVNWHVNGINIEVISWKFARERAVVRGSDTNRIIFRRMLKMLYAGLASRARKSEV